ncbi:TPA: hypothetical protein P0E33_003432 [Vibrio harveyi]|nr:hypothetical protein [Vibrio harveyi]HDM8181401.1 hypothetical protein [Vibrio harveyi]
MGETDKKYKLTRQLLRLAIDAAGYRNEDIAVKAGLSGKSVAQVSAWRNGRKNATERQMAYFIKEYGHLLKRKMEHLFCFCDSMSGAAVTRYEKLSGEVVFKHQIRVLSQKGRAISSTAVLRFIVLEDNRNFHVIKQVRGGLTREQLNKGLYYEVFHSDNEDANWYSYCISTQLDLDGMLETFNDFKTSLLDNDNPVDRLYYGNNSANYESRFFSAKQIQPLEYSFYQKLIKLGLHSELLPF